MSFMNLVAATRGWFSSFLREQAEMSAKTELFLVELPWRAEQ